MGLNGAFQGHGNQLQTPSWYALGVFRTFDPSLKHRIYASVAFAQCMLMLKSCHIALDGIYRQFQIRTVNCPGCASEMCQ